MDAGPSNSIHLFIYLPGLSCLSASALGNGKLTECRLGLASWQIQIRLKELVNLYDVKAGGLSVYCMLMYDMPEV